jgi:hypothetical protein
LPSLNAGKVAVRYGCRWTGTRRVEGPDGERFEIETTDGVYRSRALVLAVGVAEPYTPPGPAMEHAIHYADVRPAETYADRRVLIIGKQNSGFELATGLLPWARQLVLVSPSKLKLSVDTKTLVGVRARYLQPYEDHVLGGGVSVLDGSLDRIERGSDGRLTVSPPTHRRWRRPRPRVRRRDLRHRVRGPAPRSSRAGCPDRRTERLPVQTPFWESTTVPGIFFGGTIGQGAKGLQKHGVPATQGPFMAPATTPACWPPGSHRHTSGSSRSGPTLRPKRSRPSSVPSCPGRPSSSTSGAISPGADR